MTDEGAPGRSPSGIQPEARPAHAGGGNASQRRSVEAPDSARPQSRWKDIVRGMNWMGGMSLLLFWVPGLGPLLAGAIGGFKARRITSAVLAVFVPAVALGAMTFAAITWIWGAGWGSVAALGTAALLLLNVGPLFLGAILGGLAAEIRGENSAGKH